MKIRSKLILMLTIPLVALGLVAFFGFRSQSAEAEKNEASQEAARAIVDLDSLAVRIAEERLAVTSGDSPDAIAAAIERTNSALLKLANGRDPLAAPVAQRILSAENGLGQDDRGTVEKLESYTQALNDIDTAIAIQPLRGFSSDAVTSVNALQAARDVADTQEEAWVNFFALEEVTPEDLAQLTNEFGHVDFIRSAARRQVLSDGSNPFEAPSSSEAAIQLSNFEALAVRDLFQNTPDTIDPAEVFALISQNRAEWSEASEASARFVSSDAQNRGREIDDLRSLFTLLAVLGTLLLFTLIYVIGRSILGPLGRLIEHANVMTNERLPFAVAKLRTLGSSDELPELRPIPKETNDEIGTLVDAFNEIQSTAVKVATDQARSRRNVAEMFVSLGRRNQQLNHRMINLISDLEADEQDPEMLAGLYQLDHLATRMRRNAESLLVLAGNRSPRQWSRPVPVEDVVRSALSEVELFERIEIGDLPEIAMQGNVVIDVTHLLAELLDNATQFSEPSTRVSISAQETLEGVEIEVFDEGFGIGEQDLIELNERITNPPVLDEAPSRLLGLFVVGRLAQQHGIDVQLQSQPGVGTVATVSIPSALCSDEPVETAESDLPSTALAAALPAETPQSDLLEGLEQLKDIGNATAPAVAPGGQELGNWDPAAVHEDILADAAVPTMDEVMEALPSFPGVTIDEPSAAASEDVSAGETWPTATVDPAGQTAASTLASLEALPEVPSLPPLPSRRARSLEGNNDTTASPAQELAESTTLEAVAVEGVDQVDGSIDEADFEVFTPDEVAVEAVDEPFLVPSDDLAPVGDVAAENLDDVDEAPEVFEPAIEWDAGEELPTTSEGEPTEGEPTEVEAAEFEPVEFEAAEFEAAEFEAAEFEPAESDIAEAEAPEIGSSFWETAIEPPTETMSPAVVESVPTLDEVAPSDAFSVVPNPLLAPPTADLPSGLQGLDEATAFFQPSEIVAEVGAPEPVAPEAIVPAPPIVEPQPLPDLSGDFGLPTRSPQAALQATNITPELIPLEIDGAGEIVEPDLATRIESSSAFAAFASGVNRGLDKVREEHKPQFSSEGEES